MAAVCLESNEQSAVFGYFDLGYTWVKSVKFLNNLTKLLS